MTDRRRNRTVLAIVAALLVLAALVIVPGSPLSKSTRLGLDLRGGTELVYQARPTPKVPKVTPQALDDAINTIQKRTNTLGVSEPEIQRAGANEIDIGLPGVQSTRAEQEVGTTAQLQFYDWEPNVYVNLNGKFQTLFSLEQSNPQIMRQANAIALPRLPLLQAVTLAAKLKPRADANDIPPGGPSKAVVRQPAPDPAVLRPPERHRRRQVLPVRAGEQGRAAAAHLARRGRARHQELLSGQRRERLLRELPRDLPGLPADPGGEAAEAGDREGGASRQGNGVPVHAEGARRPRAAPGEPRDQGPARDRDHQGAGAAEAPQELRGGLLRARGRLRALGLRHQGPEAGVRPAHLRADRHVQLHGQGTEGVRAGHQA